MSIADAPEWPPDRSLRAIQAQLKELEPLKELHYGMAKSKEQAWRQVTESVLRRAFSSDNPVVWNFSDSSSAGTYYSMGMSSGRMQMNYVARMKAAEIALNTAIADLEMAMPEETIGIYMAEDPFAFYNDLRDILARASGEIFVVDAYIDNSLFELYLGNVQRSIQLRVLSTNLQGNSLAVAKLFAASRESFELRTTQSLHDRVVFVDDRCWVVGQSLKDAAVKKPTYMVEVSADGMRTHYEPIWAAATSVAKS
jgi:hypothetical protein